MIFSSCVMEVDTTGGIKGFGGITVCETNWWVGRNTGVNMNKKTERYAFDTERN